MNEKRITPAGTLVHGGRSVNGSAGVMAMLRIGLRELRGGVKGFQIFVACLALGVMVITAVGALSDALRAGLAQQGETILGGDLRFARMHARAAEAERAVLATYGAVSETATLRSMARTKDGEQQALAEIKAVDAAYPLVGTVTVEGDTPFAALLADRGVVADGMLLERLGVKVGDQITLGDLPVTVRGILKSEPDAVSERLTYGPRVFVALPVFQSSDLNAPGTLINWRYAIKRDATSATDKATLKQVEAQISRALPDGGFTVLDRHDPSPQINRVLDRLRQFLILIGLASLLVGGVGIANAVSTFIDKRIKVIATLRSIGASGRQIFTVFLVQILAMSGLGIIIGLALGALLPFVIDRFYADALPVRIAFSVSWQSLAIAALYGVVVALLFALWPLGRAENVRASVLFRDQSQSLAGRPRLSIIIAMVALVAVMMGIALLTSEPRSIALYVCAGLLVMLITFAGLGRLVTRLAARLPRPSSPTLALAVRNIAAPDGLTRSVVLSLGTGLSLLVAVALVNASLVADLTERRPEKAPDYYLLDVPKQDYAALSKDVTTRLPGTELASAAMLRGRIVSLNGVPVEKLKPPADAQWIFNGDRGLSYSVEVPEGSTVTDGEWWADGYAGPPLVSFEKALAEKLGLKVGDSVTVNVLGRNITARIANLREVKWESLAINFVLVYSPNTLSAAPHNLLATIRLPDNTPRADEAAMARALGKSFPSVSAIRVRDVIEQFNGLFEKIMVAIQMAGSVTLAAGALVLAGALATAQRRRILEAVILKTLGARRRQILTAHAYEYGLLAAIAALVAIGLGSVVAYVAVTQIMDLTFVLSPSAIGVTLAVAAVLIGVFGGFGTWAVLRAPSVPYLRSE